MCKTYLTLPDLQHEDVSANLKQQRQRHNYNQLTCGIEMKIRKVFRLMFLVFLSSEIIRIRS